MLMILKLNRQWGKLLFSGCFFVFAFSLPTLHAAPDDEIAKAAESDASKRVYQRKSEVKTYTVKRATGKVSLDGSFSDDPQWKNADVLNVDALLSPKKVEFMSQVKLKMLYDDENIYGLFQVDDRYVKAVKQAYQSEVYDDSCVEFFVHPNGKAGGYFNFEFSANGTMLLYHVQNIRRKDFKPVPKEDGDRMVERWHSLPDVVDPEITEPTTWRLGFRIPLAFFVKCSEIDPSLSGQVWGANFTKCADKTSNPHWLSWQELPQSDFHLPAEFGQIVFE